MSDCPECGRDTVTAGACTPDCGWVAHEAVAILTDLIAELREGHPTFGDEPPLWVKTALYAAENRLRKSTRDD